MSKASKNQADRWVKALNRFASQGERLTAPGRRPKHQYDRMVDALNHFRSEDSEAELSQGAPILDRFPEPILPSDLMLEALERFRRDDPPQPDPDIDRSPAAIARRRTAARSAAGSLEIEGQHLTPEERALNECYILGEITVGQLRLKLLALP